MSLLTILILLAAPAGAGEGGIAVELNKLEPAKGACRVYLVFKNRTSGALINYKPDLVLFGTDGVIVSRLAVEGGPLPAGATRVRLFDIKGTACTAVGRLLLNGVAACADAKGPRVDCGGLTETGSRAKVPFTR